MQTKQEWRQWHWCRIQQCVQPKIFSIITILLSELVMTVVRDERDVSYKYCCWPNTDNLYGLLWLSIWFRKDQQLILVMYANVKAKNWEFMGKFSHTQGILKHTFSNTQGIYGVNVEAIILRVANIMLLILVIIIYIYIYGNLLEYHESYSRI